MSGIRISSRYAKSLLDLSVEQGKVDTAFADMQLVAKTIHDNRDFAVMLSSPVIKSSKKEVILEAVFRGKIADGTLAFITLMARKGREKLMAEVAQSFINQTKEYKNITTVELISPQKLDESTRTKALEAATRMAKGEVELVERIDPELIGGFILRVADKQVDTSVSSKIRQLRRDFSENPYIPEI